MRMFEIKYLLSRYSCDIHKKKICISYALILRVALVLNVRGLMLQNLAGVDDVH